MSERETATEAHADAATLNTTTPRGRDGVRAAQREYGAILAAAVVADIRPHAPELCDSHENLREENAALTARLAAVARERAAARAGVMELLEYTRHRVPCPQFNNVSMLGCTCGLWAVFERALSKEPPDGR